MQIQVNSDKSVIVNVVLTKFVEDNLNDVLRRFSERLTRVEVHLSDANGEKSGTEDKRCMIEARAARRDPVVVTDKAATVEMAVRGASHKMQDLLTSLFKRSGERP